jgi:hypothetical protein
MIALPVVERELRAAAKRSSTYWTRFGFALLGAAGGMFMLYASRRGGPFATSGILVKSWSLFLCFYFLAKGVRLTADSLSQERREGTLGLLFLTGLKAQGIVISKLIAPALNCYGLLVASAPVLVIGLLAGGIGMVEFARIIIALGVTIVLALSIGMTISAFGRNRKKSESTAGLVAAGFWFLPPVLDQALQRRWPEFSPHGLFKIFAPSYLHQTALNGDAGFWAAALGNLLVVGFLGVIAIWKLGDSWQDLTPDLTESRRERWLRRWQYCLRGGSPGRGRLRTALLDVNAFSWLIVRERWRDIRIWGVLVIGAGGTGLAAWSARDEAGLVLRWLCLTVPVWSLLIRVLFVDEAGRALGQQRSTGALELLLATPLSVPDLVDGQWLALRRRFFWPTTALVGFAGLVMALSRWLLSPAFFNLPPTELRLVSLAIVIMFGADLVALGWVSMWLSLKCRRQVDVAGSAFARISLLPNLAWIPLALFLGAFFPGSGFRAGLISWLLTGLAFDLWFSAWSRARLYKNFRRLSTLEYLHSGPSGAWGGWLGSRYARWVGTKPFRGV